MLPKMTLALGLLLCAPAVVLAQNRQDRASEFPPGEGRELAVSVCATACHDGTAILMKRDGEGGWRRNVERMVVQKGAQISPDDLETLVRYLSTRLGPGSGQMQTGPLPPGAVGGAAKTAKEVQLPAGPGKELVETRCVLCHDLGRVVSLRRTNREWDQMARNMIGRGGPQVGPAQIDMMIAYLTTHFRKEADQPTR